LGFAREGSLKAAKEVLARFGKPLPQSPEPAALFGRLRRIGFLSEAKKNKLGQISKKTPYLARSMGATDMGF
jgi:hypothetical protein